MTTITAPAERAGHSVIPQETARSYNLIVLVHDRPGAIDRVVSLFRRRRANMQTLVLGRTEQADVVRLSVLVNDSEASTEYIVEQLRKIIDVQQAFSLSEQ